MSPEAVVAYAQLVLDGYRRGIFPMARPDGHIDFFQADPRGVLPLAGFHAPRRLLRRLRARPFEVKVDQSFAQVVEGCARRDNTWISSDLRQVYFELHRHGHAHCVEAWEDGRLAGGLYGVSLGAAFFGESMYADRPDASKAALVFLVNHLRTRRYELLDCQMVTAHTERFGAIWIPAREYLDRLRLALRKERVFWP